MQVCQLDDADYFVAEIDADESPLEPGVFLIPAGAVPVARPTNIPSGHRAKFDHIAQDWIVEPTTAPDEPTLAQAQWVKGIEVMTWLNEQTATIEWDGHVWQTDAVAQSRLSAEITMAGAGVRPDPSPWRTLDNQMVMLSAVQLQEFAAAIYLHQRNCILESFALKDAIEAATTIEEVEAIQVPSQP